MDRENRLAALMVRGHVVKISLPDGGAELRHNDQRLRSRALRRKISAKPPEAIRKVRHDESDPLPVLHKLRG